MPSLPRKAILPGGEEHVVHAISRCVRQAWLCGRDAATGRDYEHRRAWIHERVMMLAGSFAIEVIAYAIMHNHSHLVLWCRPALASHWSDIEVARRWLRLSRVPGATDEARVRALAADQREIAKRREQLGSVSWFMRYLNEHIAKLANKEDACTGRFWEGRFKSQLLADEGALLACMAYVDLNPVRAQLAGSLEESAFTSVLDRLTGHRARQALEALGHVPDPTPEQLEMIGQARRQATIDSWLCPLGQEAGRHTVVDLDLAGYLALVEWTGKRVAGGKPGVLPREMQDAMTRSGLDAAAWVETVLGFGKKFSHVAGTARKIRELARQRGQSRAKGTKAAAAMYTRASG